MTPEERIKAADNQITSMENWLTRAINTHYAALEETTAYALDDALTHLGRVRRALQGERK